MSKLVGVDSYLGPEMKSTGEVMGIDRDFPGALSKALLAASLSLKKGDGVLLSIADQHKAESLPLIRELLEADCQLYATEGTAAMIQATGMPVTMVTKLLTESYPNVVDVINDGTVAAVVNTLSGGHVGHAGRLLHPPRRRRTPHPLLHLPGHRPRRRRSAIDAAGAATTLSRLTRICSRRRGRAICSVLRLTLPLTNFPVSSSSTL